MAAAGRLNNEALDRVLKGPGGGVARDVQRRARNVQLAAKDYAPKDTRLLERSIVTRPEQGPGGEFLVRVIAGENLPDNRALWMEEGTRPHQIRPVKAKRLAFTVGGKRIFALLVNHPGTAALHFMKRAAEAGRR